MAVAVMNAALVDADPFTAQPVWRVRIRLAPENMQALRIESRKYAPAEVQLGDEVLRDVGVHLKGATGSFQTVDEKPGWTLSFGRFRRGQRYRGLEKVHLNNSVEDPTYLKPQLAGELFRAAGVPTPRMAHALVELNDRKIGLYVVQEGFTEDFIARNFQGATGNLYDTSLGHDVDEPMRPQVGGSRTTGQAELRRLARAALEPHLDRRWEMLGETLDMDRFLNFMAMEVMLCHWDGYCLGRNNFRVLYAPASDKIIFLPAGMDQLLAKADMSWRPDMTGLIARAVMQIPEGRKRYAERFQALFDSLFRAPQLTNRASQLLRGLAPVLPPGQFRSIRSEAVELCARIVERQASLQKQLSEPELAVPDSEHPVVALGGWKAFGEPVGGRMLEGSGPGGRAALQIVAGPKTLASWRTVVRLKPGRYRFRGDVRVMGVTPLTFGASQGASLRVFGKKTRSSELIGSGAWEPLEVVFEVVAPFEDVVLICELRATAGVAWFDKGSLMLTCERRHEADVGFPNERGVSDTGRRLARHLLQR
jgi:hypothetical protein